MELPARETNPAKPDTTKDTKSDVPDSDDDDEHDIDEILDFGDTPGIPDTSEPARPSSAAEGTKPAPAAKPELEAIYVPLDDSSADDIAIAAHEVEQAS